MSEDRKKDHIELTFSSRPTEGYDQKGFYYEPLFDAHPNLETDHIKSDFIGHKFNLPLWVSSMTGGTQLAETINRNLAMACGEFGFGMGLGSCRSLLDSKERFKDFDVKKYMNGSPLYTNFGIAQLEELIDNNALSKIEEVTSALSGDGIIIHVNPLQEWAQPEGDRFKRSPLETISQVVEFTKYPVIVKEVGQGFGPRSLRALCKLDLMAIEFASLGGTNFTMLELSRLKALSSCRSLDNTKLSLVGHSASEMVGFINDLDPKDMKCKNFIISGGITSAVDGLLLTKKLNHQAVFGMASQFLKYATGDYEVLRQYIYNLKDELLVSNLYLKEM